MKDKDWIKMTLTPIQKQMLKEKCPACHTGELHEVFAYEEEENESLLYCNYCLCAVDSDGGFTN